MNQVTLSTFMLTIIAINLLSNASNAGEIIAPIDLKYVPIDSGTCESNKYLPIYSVQKCKDAATRLEFDHDSSIDRRGLTTFQNILDGCSLYAYEKYNRLFVQKKGYCYVGAYTPGGTLENKNNPKVTCKSSPYVYSICEIKKEFVTVDSGTCESNGYYMIDTVEECKRAVTNLRIPYDITFSTLKFTPYQNILDGCSVYQMDSSWLTRVYMQKKGSCYVGANTPIFMPKYSKNPKVDCKSLPYIRSVCSIYGPSN